MQTLSTKTSQFSNSVIRRMTRVSNRYGAINLSQGFPDFDPPREITDCLAEVAHKGPHQYAITWGAQGFREALSRKQVTYTHKRQLFCEGLRRLGMPLVEPQGAYFVMCDISKAHYKSDEEFAVELARRVGVGGVPGSCFFNVFENRFIRFHFAKSDDVLNAALRRLEGWQDRMAR